MRLGGSSNCSGVTKDKNLSDIFDLQFDTKKSIFVCSLMTGFPKTTQFSNDTGGD